MTWMIELIVICVTGRSLEPVNHAENIYANRQEIQLKAASEFRKFSIKKARIRNFKNFLTKRDVENYKYQANTPENIKSKENSQIGQQEILFCVRSE